MQGVNYDNRLKQLGLMKLEGRRMRSDLVETFKIVDGKYIMILILNYFSNKMKLVEGDMTKNCLRKDLD